MRVNIYAEELTDNVEIIKKEINGQVFTGLRIYLYLPVTMPDGTQHQGPFLHSPQDDDSSAVTFWGKQDLRGVLRKALKKLDAYYDSDSADSDDAEKAIPQLTDSQRVLLMECAGEGGLVISDENWHADRSVYIRQDMDHLIACGLVTISRRSGMSDRRHYRITEPGRRYMKEAGFVLLDVEPPEDSHV